MCVVRVETEAPALRDRRQNFPRLKEEKPNGVDSKGQEEKVQNLRVGLLLGRTSTLPPPLRKVL